MGLEIECKLAVESRSLLDRILCDTSLSLLTAAPWREKRMRTTYFDTTEQFFRTLHWTLRLRKENDRQLICLKTPQKAQYTCSEWQAEVQAFDEAALRHLVELGAPQELLQYTLQTKLLPVCGAEFLRRCVMLRLSDGSMAELAGDDGVLFGATQRLAFTELELELYDGKPDEMLALAQVLCEQYGLTERTESKFMRAKQLR